MITRTCSIMITRTCSIMITRTCSIMITRTCIPLRFYIVVFLDNVFVMEVLCVLNIIINNT